MTAQPLTEPITLSVAHYIDQIDRDPAHRARTTYIVVDVIRATTTLSVMFDRGVRRVFVARDVDAARKVRETLPGAIVAGEVNAVAPDDFDQGNSPDEWGKLDLTNREVLFSTTNGARALHAALGGGPVFAGALRNATAVCQAALRAARLLPLPDSDLTAPAAAVKAPGPTIMVVCSGRDRRPADDDSLCAGWLLLTLRRLAREEGQPTRLGPGAQRALDLLATTRGATLAAGDSQGGGDEGADYTGSQPGDPNDPNVDDDGAWLYHALLASAPARDVLDVDLGADIGWCAAIDASDAVPMVAGHDVGRGLVLIERAPASPISLPDDM